MTPSTRDPERRSPSGMPPFVRHDMAVPHRRPHTLKDTVMNHASMIRLGLLSLIACTAFASASAMAADTTVPGHPRVNEVNQRIDNQQARIAKGVANGTITPKQAANDQRRAANIAQRESAAEAKHHGHLTKGETRRLNRAENRNSRHIHRQRH
jgi:hypothetical protein